MIRLLLILMATTAIACESQIVLFVGGPMLDMSPGADGGLVPLQDLAASPVDATRLVDATAVTGVDLAP
jgi:hypothetical protein